MKVNGEVKILWGVSMIVIVYVTYMTTTPDPADGAVLAGIVGTIAALVSGVAVKMRRLRYD